MDPRRSRKRRQDRLSAVGSASVQGYAGEIYEALRFLMPSSANRQTAGRLVTRGVCEAPLLCRQIYRLSSFLPDERA